jgi:hypothetical protein
MLAWHVSGVCQTEAYTGRDPRSRHRSPQPAHMQRWWRDCMRRSIPLSAEGFAPPAGNWPGTATAYSHSEIVKLYVGVVRKNCGGSRESLSSSNTRRGPSASAPSQSGRQLFHVQKGLRLARGNKRLWVLTLMEEGFVSRSEEALWCIVYRGVFDIHDSKASEIQSNSLRSCRRSLVIANRCRVIQPVSLLIPLFNGFPWLPQKNLLRLSHDMCCCRTRTMRHSMLWFQLR